MYYKILSTTPNIKRSKTRYGSPPLETGGMMKAYAKV